MPKKANKAKTTNELSSNNENIKRKQIRKKQRDTKNQNKVFSDTDDTSLDDNSNDGNIYPITPSILNSGKSVNGKYYYLWVELTTELFMHIYFFNLADIH